MRRSYGRRRRSYGRRRVVVVRRVRRRRVPLRRRIGIRL